MNTFRLLGSCALGVLLSTTAWAADDGSDLSPGISKPITPPDDFEPLSQSQRLENYARGIGSPMSIVWAAAGAGFGEISGTPKEWKGAAGYGFRVGDEYAQYTIERTLNYGLAAALHEDNRYFPSGEARVFPRIRYAVMSSLRSRHDNGKQYFSVSQFGGVLGQAFISRAWQPRSTATAGDAAISFGFWMAGDMGFNVVREFWPQKHLRRE